MSSYDTANLLAQVRRLTYAPTSAATGSQDSDILAIATFELHSSLVPRLRRANAEFFDTRKDTTVVVNQDTYQLPTRAVAGSLRDVQILNTDGTLSFFPRLELADIPRLTGWTPTSVGTPIGFYTYGNSLVLFPSPSSSPGSLRMVYEQRPGDLVTTSAVAIISAINTSTGVITTTATIPATFTTSATYDLVQANPHFDSLAVDLSASAASGTSMTFTASNLPSTLKVGDYVCLAGQSPVPQIPYELHPILIQRTAVKLLEARGDDRLGPAQAKLEEMEQAAWDLLAPRIKGKPKVVVNRNWI